jgi:hypothetical protein
MYNQEKQMEDNIVQAKIVQPSWHIKWTCEDNF